MNSTISHIDVDICTYAGAHKTVKTHLQNVVLDHQNSLLKLRLHIGGLMLFVIAIIRFGG